MLNKISLTKILRPSLYNNKLILICHYKLTISWISDTSFSINETLAEDDFRGVLTGDVSSSLSDHSISADVIDCIDLADDLLAGIFSCPSLSFSLSYKINMSINE